MGIKKFTAVSMQKALKQIREELGEDAIIVSNRKLPNGKVEISVSIENAPVVEETKALVPQAKVSNGGYEPANTIEPLRISNEKAKQLLASVRTSQQSRAVEGYSARQPVEMQPSVVEKASELSELNVSHLIKSTIQNAFQGHLQTSMQQLQQELQALREQMIAPPNVPVPSTEVVKQLKPEQNKKALALVHKKWRQTGLDEILFRQFCQSSAYQTIQQENELVVWKTSLAYLKQQLTRYTRNPIEAPGIYAFVGPTGAGKTTSLAKLAVRQVNRWGANKVGIVTMDSFRIGAWEQMQRLGTIIGVETALCRQEDSLLDTIADMRHCRTLLVDTAGLSHQDERRLVQWKKLAELGDELETFLVAQANLQSTVLEQLTKAYRPAQVRGVIYTKCDEITSLGEAVSALVKARLPWVFACDGQKIPDDLKAMTVDTVVQMLITTSRQKYWKLGGHASEQEALLAQAMGE